MRLARLEGRNSCHVFLIGGGFSAQDLSRFGTSLKMEASVAGTHWTSARRTSLSLFTRMMKLLYGYASFLYQIYTPYREGGSDKFQTQHSFHFFLHICKEKTNWQISKVIFRGNMWRAELQNPVVHFCFLRRKWGSLLVHYVNGNYAVSKASP